MNEIFEKAAKSALWAWKQDDSDIEDLVNELWVWYLERPSTRKKFEEMPKFEAQKAARTAALQMLAGESLNSDLFNGRNLYSSESIKDALKGKSTNRYLNDILPKALSDLDAKNSEQAEALRARYTDGVVPSKEGGAAMLLARAHKSLTEHVNIIAITAGVDSEGNVSQGPGSRHAVFPEHRRAKNNGHSDPTGDIAVMLIGHPELRDDYLEELPIREFLGGRGYAQSD